MIKYVILFVVVVLVYRINNKKLVGKKILSNKTSCYINSIKPKGRIVQSVS